MGHVLSFADIAHDQGDQTDSEGASHPRHAGQQGPGPRVRCTGLLRCDGAANRDLQGYDAMKTGHREEVGRWASPYWTRDKEIGQHPRRAHSRDGGISLHPSPTRTSSWRS
ncbi:MAG: hypothetical protein MZU91_03030 [Desulfosudis oleivorans]|nr:hypothetical protein [Desulfosudis oleivorans]